MLGTLVSILRVTVPFLAPPECFLSLIVPILQTGKGMHEEVK